MNKLYALYYVEKELTFSRFLAASNEISKLTSVVPVGFNSSSGNIIKHTEEDVYPYWFISEVPYIC